MVKSIQMHNGLEHEGTRGHSNLRSTMAPASRASNAKKHLQSRVSYLHRAAAYLTDLQLEALKTTNNPGNAETHVDDTQETSQDATILSKDTEKAQAKLTFPQSKAEVPKQSITRPLLSPLARHLISDLQGISKKSLIRLQPSIKHTICKRCQSYLKSGHNMTSTIENNSRGGKRPWASVRVDTCSTCDAQKRYPINTKRQPRRKDRVQKAQAARSEGSCPSSVLRRN